MLSHWRASWAIAFVVSGATGVAAKGPFLTQTDNQTWVLGNDLWNVTEGANYATKLYSTLVPGQDLVGDAWGHYVDIGTRTILFCPERARRTLTVL